MVNALKVIPTLTTPAFYMGDENIPPTSHGGDATANVPFLTGSSMVLGAKRDNALNDAMNDNGIILETDIKKFNQILVTKLQDAHYTINASFTVLRNQMVQNEDAIEIYHNALSQCNDPQNRIKIAKGLQILYLNQIMKVSKDDINEIIRLADQASTVTDAQELKVENFNNTLEKIAYHKTVALIKKVDGLLSERNKDTDTINKLVKEIEKNIPKIQFSHELQNKYSDILRKLADPSVQASMVKSHTK